MNKKTIIIILHGEIDNPISKPPKLKQTMVVPENIILHFPANCNTNLYLTGMKYNIQKILNLENDIYKKGNLCDDLNMFPAILDDNKFGFLMNIMGIIDIDDLKNNKYKIAYKKGEWGETQLKNVYSQSIENYEYFYYSDLKPKNIMLSNLINDIIKKDEYNISNNIELNIHVLSCRPLTSIPLYGNCLGYLPYNIGYPNDPSNHFITKIDFEYKLEIDNDLPFIYGYKYTKNPNYFIIVINKSIHDIINDISSDNNINYLLNSPNSKFIKNDKFWLINKNIVKIKGQELVTRIIRYDDHDMPASSITCKRVTKEFKEIDIFDIGVFIIGIYEKSSNKTQKGVYLDFVNKIKQVINEPYKINVFKGVDPCFLILLHNIFGKNSLNLSIFHEYKTEFEKLRNGNVSMINLLDDIENLDEFSKILPPKSKFGSYNKRIHSNSIIPMLFIFGKWHKDV